MPKGKGERKDKARKKFSHLLDLQRPTPDLIGAFAGDRNMSPAEKESIGSFRRRTGDRFYSEILFTLTHQYYPHEESEAIWKDILTHKESLTRRLERNPGITVATLDYLANVRGAIEKPAMITTPEIKTIAEVALRDGLTGLFDHSTFYAKLELEIHRHHRYRSPVSLIMADVDDFKEYNDRYGHPAGDSVLVGIAGTLVETTRDLDVCSRYGGEEFAVILPQTGQRRALGTAERIRNGVERKFEGDHRVTVSLGIATCPLDADDVDSLVSRADENLYKAKKAGKNRVMPEGE